MNLKIWNKLSVKDQLKIWEYWKEQYYILTGSEIKGGVL